jgi:hypothetical protein
VGGDNSSFCAPVGGFGLNCNSKCVIARH